MAAFIGYITAETLMLLVVLGIVLVLARGIGAMRKYPIRVHLVGLALVWLLAIGLARNASAPIGAYLVTLVSIWDYRRETRKPPSGWYRIGAGLTVAWIAVWLLVVSALNLGSFDSESAQQAAWVFAGFGLMIWGLGWLVQWIRAGFSKGTSSAGAHDGAQ